MTGKKTLQKLNKLFTQQQLSDQLGISKRTIQRWKSKGIPKKSPLKNEIDRLLAVGELTKRKRSKKSIAPILQKAKNTDILSKESKNKSKKYLVVKIDYSAYVSTFKNNLAEFRETIISQWFPFYQDFRFMYLKGFLFKLDPDDPNRPLELTGSIITKTRNADEINASLNDFIDKVILFIANYESTYKIAKISIQFINIVQ